jgi:adenylate cyclase class 2
MPKEIEIKFRIENLPALARALKQAGFKQLTRSTHEMNSLYDLPGQKLRKRGEMLRCASMAKILGADAQGEKARPAGIKCGLNWRRGWRTARRWTPFLRALGFAPTFRYEKYRAEWSDGTGHVVLDETPIGNFGEIEGPSRWIDRTARALGIRQADYITQTYAPMFFEWKRRTKSPATEMTFRALGKKSKTI